MLIFILSEIKTAKQALEAAEDLEEARKGGGAKVGESERSGLRVTKTSKEGPEHIVMQLRKAVSLGAKHEGVQFKNGKSKVDSGHARSALSRYNSAKPAEKEEMQKHMNHSSLRLILQRNWKKAWIKYPQVQCFGQMS